MPEESKGDSALDEIRDTARSIAAEELKPAAAEIDRTRLCPRENMNVPGGAGFHGSNDRIRLANLAPVDDCAAGAAPAQAAISGYGFPPFHFRSRATSSESCPHTRSACRRL